MGSAIKAIQTTYNGIRFRSRTEARWAVFMDAAGIPYAYEAEGFYFQDGTTYLPDFWLPDQRTFLECKGVMSDKDLHKIKTLVVESDYEVIVGYPDMKFDVYDVDYRMVGYAYKSEMPWLMECDYCGKKYFLNAEHNLNLCRCCGYIWSEGGPSIRVLCNGFGHNFQPDAKHRKEKFDAIEKAKSARFEFGEDGTNG